MLTSGNIDVSAAMSWAEGVVGPIVSARELRGGMTSTMLSLTPEAGELVVLRLMTREPWRRHGQALTSRESQVQRMLAGNSVVAPRSLALDADGGACGYPAHLMSLLPGRGDVDRIDRDSLAHLADVLATIHDVVPTIDVRGYQSWAWEAKFVVPLWAVEPSLWEEAFALLSAAPPAFEPCFIHRDFQLGNVLWSGTEISGVVDWVETSMGPAWLDVAHCCTNIALRHGSAPAAEFAAAYVERTRREPQRYFEVMDVVGFLPPPGEPGFPLEPAERSRLEERLRTSLAR